MSEWIESHASLPRHRKTRRLARLLDIDIPHALGYMHMLWYYALDFAPGGDLSGHDHGAIADGCQWDGDADAFVAAFVEAGWLDLSRDPCDTLLVHDWEDCNQSHRKRLADAERQRQKRHRDKESPDMSRDVTVTVTSVTPDRTGQDRQDKTDRQEDALVSLALAELPETESSEEDYRRTIKRYRTKLTDEHIERIIVQLGNWRPNKPRPKLHLTLAAWLNKEPRDPLPPSHVVYETPNEEGCVPMPKELRGIFEKAGVLGAFGKPEDLSRKVATP